MLETVSGKMRKIHCIFSFPTSACKTGSKLKKNKDSACNFCYAAKIEKLRPNVLKAYQKNLDEYNANPEKFCKQASASVVLADCRHCRLCVSGDLQNLQMLINIVEHIVKKNPDTKFWLPTQERKIVLEYLENIGQFPENLCIRVSSPFVDVPAREIPGTTSSMIRKNSQEGILCPARENKGQCGTCKLCWNNKIQLISYPLKIGRKYYDK